MEEENILPPEQPSEPAPSGAPEQAAPKKRRGRPPKVRPEGEAAPAKPRRRQAKAAPEEALPAGPDAAPSEASPAAPADSGGDFGAAPDAGASAPSAPHAGSGDDDYDDDAEFESYSRRNRERESNKRNDEFSFTGGSEYMGGGDSDSGGEDADSDIPESFSTTDEDLLHDSYRGHAGEQGESGDASRGADFHRLQGDSGDSAAPQDADWQPGRAQRFEKWRNFRQAGAQGRLPVSRQQNRGQAPQDGRARQDRFAQGRQNDRQNRQNMPAGAPDRLRQNGRQQGAQGRQQGQQGRQGQQAARQNARWLKLGDRRPEDQFDPTPLMDWAELKTSEGISALAEASFSPETEIFNYADYWGLGQRELQEKLAGEGVEFDRYSGSSGMFAAFLKRVRDAGGAIRVSGVLDVFEGGQGGAVCFSSDSYRLKKYCVYVPQKLIESNGLLRGCEVSGLAVPPRADGGEACPVLLKVETVMGMSSEEARALTPFNELVPYYPTRRIILEADADASWDNLSMRVVDLLTPLGLGQRALIVAPPRTGKTVLMQGMAKSIRRNVPDAHLIVLMVDERPEEVTDFRRTVDAEIIASTFDEDAFSHVHAAEMVISKARRMVEAGRDVVILLDSITRLARAYNTLMPNSGKIMSGGVEANALQKPKRFFGSARNIEGGGSLTIIGTALVETGSKMDEVIFEEFKGTGNLELHLDRSLVDKRIFPAINIEKSGTRKEELLYHPDEMLKIYSLRRAMKGVPSAESMELLLQRLKKVKTNVEFLMGINR